MIDPQITELERQAAAAGLKITPILREEGIAPSTWFRWREKGVDPKVSTLRRVREAIERKLEAGGVS